MIQRYLQQAVQPRAAIKRKGTRTKKFVTIFFSKPLDILPLFQTNDIVILEKALTKEDRLLMVSKFRHCYPQGSLMSELVTIKHGQYIVRVLVQVDGITLSTGLSAASTIEQAEDQARERAIALLDLEPQPQSSPALPPSVTPKSASVSPQTSPSSSLSAPSLVSEGDAAGSHRLEKLSFSEVRSVATPPPAPEPVKGQPIAAVVSPRVVPPPDAPSPKGEESLFSSTVEPSPLPDPPQATMTSTLSDYGVEATPSNLATSTPPPSNTPIDFSDVIAKTNIELKRLGWTSDQGRDYLLQTYGKRSRQLLTDEELLEFLHYLEKEPMSS